MNFNLLASLMEITKLEPLNFQSQMSSLLNNDHAIVELIILLKHSQPSLHQKKMATAGINWLVSKRCEIERQQAPSLWQVIRCIALEDPPEWNHLKRLIPSLVKLLDLLRKDIYLELTECFRQLPLCSLSVLMEALFETDIFDDQELVIRVLFDSIEDYINAITSSLNISYNSESDQIDPLRKEVQDNALKALLQYLNHLQTSEQPTYRHVLLSLTHCKPLFSLFAKVLCFRPGTPSFQFYEQVPQNLWPLLPNNSPYNQAKRLTLQMVTSVLSSLQYDLSQQYFQTVPLLQLMRALLQPAFEGLESKTASNHIKDEDLQTISLLIFLTRCVKFSGNFFFFYRTSHQLLFQIATPLLSFVNKQNLLYHQNPRQFKACLEQLVEAVEVRGESSKSHCAYFVEKFAERVDGVLTQMTILLCLRIKRLLLAQGEQADRQVGGLLTMLSIFSCSFHKRPDIQRKICQQVFACQQLLNLSGSSLARLFLLLSYCVSFFEAEDEGTLTRLKRVAQSAIQQEEGLSLCTAQFIENLLSEQMDVDFLQQVLKSASHIDSSATTNLLFQLVETHLNQVPCQTTNFMIEQLTSRLIIYYQQGRPHGSPALYSCLNVLKVVADQKEYLRANPSVHETIWPIFDFFQLSDSIEYEDNVLQIFNSVLKSCQSLEKKHFSFLKYFNNIQLKYGSSDKIYETVCLLLSRGGFVFESQSGKEIFQNLIDVITGSAVNRTEGNVKRACYLMGFAYIHFKTLMPDQIQFYELTRKFYEQKYNTMTKATRSSLICYWLCARIGLQVIDFSPILSQIEAINSSYEVVILCEAVRQLIRLEPSSFWVLLQPTVALLKRVANEEQFKFGSCKIHPLSFSPSSDPFEIIEETLEELKNSQTDHFQTLLQNILRTVSQADLKFVLNTRVAVNKQIRHFTKAL